jgi:hypothetical protein
MTHRCGAECLTAVSQRWLTLTGGTCCTICSRDPSSPLGAKKIVVCA